jgi:hypothetical protein
MFQLPNNATVAALALVLGIALGAGGYHLLFGEFGPEPTASPSIQDRDRPLQPRDTSGEDTPQVEIRYRTRVDTLVDTVRVEVPVDLDPFVVSDPTPIDVESDRVTWTYWDPTETRWEQRVYTVPRPTWEGHLYALAKVESRPLRLPNLDRVALGLGASLRYNDLRARVEGTIPHRLRPRLSAGVIWRF